jgi:Bacterial Ig-like domain
MNLRLRISLLAAVIVLACSQHVPDGPDTGDHTPPSVASVVAWDRTHVVVVFNERVSRETAENAAHYKLGPAAPKEPPVSVVLSDSTSGVRTASMHVDNRTVTLTSGSMDASGYVISVRGVSDLHGNAITKTVKVNFEGNAGDDVTPPEIVLQSPAPDATQASTGGFVVIGFSEAVPLESFIKAFRVSGDGAMRLDIRSEDYLHYYCDLGALQPGADYTVSLAGVEDIAGNVMPDARWNFRTEATLDSIAPTVISSRPTANAVMVDTGTQLSFSFSEPMDPYSVILRPRVNFNAARWSNGGRKVTYETAWQPGKQYTIQIRPGDMRDLSGNRSVKLFTLVFSTDATLKPGRFSGTIIGDPNSTSASDPADGLVFAGPTSPQDLYTSIVTAVRPAGVYEFTHLARATYFPFCVIDSNHDKTYRPLYGDAVGIYGVSDWWSNQEPQEVTTTDAPVSGIDFPIYDPTAVYGLLSYDNANDATIHVGLFDTAGFDPISSEPVVSVIAQRSGTSDYTINSLDTGPIPDGDYYVAAYVDINGTDMFEPADDPMGVYGGATPIAIHIAGGVDAPNTSFSLQSPVPGTSVEAVHWPGAPRSGRLDRLLAAIGAASDPPR